jgi:dihydrodipicolinate synthase/N-acetylneuraminate lyase
MRYYLDAGAGGIAVGMHFTEFEIRKPGIDLYEPVLRTCAEEVDGYVAREGRPVVKIAGVTGDTAEAIEQVETARRLGYHFAIASLSGWQGASEWEMLEHLEQLAGRMPLFGFYLAPEFGGVPLSYDFWRRFVDLENVHGIKIATFNRYRTLDVARAVADAGRQEDVVLYTGNDDSIVHDLIIPFRFSVGGVVRTVRIRGGLLGQWACWTRPAVELLERIHEVVADGGQVPDELLTTAARITDVNGAIFDAAHGYAGSIPGVKEVLRRQGLLENTCTLKPDETLSPGQTEEITRVHAAYPELNDDEFVRANLDRWLGA